MGMIKILKTTLYFPLFGGRGAIYKKMKSIIILMASVWALFTFNRCEDPKIPKPRGYFRIPMPEKAYQTIEGPQYTVELLKSSKLEINPDDKNWSTIQYPQLKASIYLTYFKNKDLGTLAEDARQSAFKHSIKADDIIGMPFALPEHKVYGMIYSIEGNAASPAIFQITDSVDQFVHGALYFNCEPNADSLKPLIYFVRQDIQHFIETFRWSNPSK